MPFYDSFFLAFFCGGLKNEITMFSRNVPITIIVDGAFFLFFFNPFKFGCFNFLLLVVFLTFAFGMTGWKFISRHSACFIYYGGGFVWVCFSTMDSFCFGLSCLDRVVWEVVYWRGSVDYHTIPYHGWDGGFSFSILWGRRLLLDSEGCVVLGFSGVCFSSLGGWFVFLFEHVCCGVHWLIRGGGRKSISYVFYSDNFVVVEHPLLCTLNMAPPPDWV